MTDGDGTRRTFLLGVGSGVAIRGGVDGTTEDIFKTKLAGDERYKGGGGGGRKRVWFGSKETEEGVDGFINFLRRVGVSTLTRLALLFFVWSLDATPGACLQR